MTTPSLNLVLDWLKRAETLLPLQRRLRDIELICLHQRAVTDRPESLKRALTALHEDTWQLTPRFFPSGDASSGLDEGAQALLLAASSGRPPPLPSLDDWAGVNQLRAELRALLGIFERAHNRSELGSTLAAQLGADPEKPSSQQALSQLLSRVAGAPPRSSGSTSAHKAGLDLKQTAELRARLGALSKWLTSLEPMVPARSARATSPRSAPLRGQSEPSVSLEGWVAPAELCIELGANLTGLAEKGSLCEGIGLMRNQLLQDLGLALPPVHIRDNLHLDPNDYRILLRGEELGRARLQPQHHMAMRASSDLPPLDGEPVRDPVFGVDAYWIVPALKAEAKGLGYTVVDHSAVLRTHFSDLATLNAHQIFAFPQLEQIRQQLRQTDPLLLEALAASGLSWPTVLSVFRNLLSEGLSVRDAPGILLGLTLNASRVNDDQVLTELARQRMSGHITRRYSGMGGVISYIGCAPDVEETLSKGILIDKSGRTSLTVEPENLRKLIVRFRDAVERWKGTGQIVIMTPPLVRGPLRRLIKPIIPRVPVISYSELLPTVTLDRIAVVSLRGRGQR